MVLAPDPTLVVETLKGNPAHEKLAAWVRNEALAAAAARRNDFASRHATSRANVGALPEGLSPSDLTTPLGNVLAVLEHGVETPDEAALLGALLALSAEKEAESEAEEAAFVAHTVWLAAHTPCDALALLEAVVGDRPVFFQTLARITTEPGQVAADFGRTEALVAAAALAQGQAPTAARERSEALGRTMDPAIRALLESGATAREPLDGELVPAPLGPFATLALALTALLFAWHALRLVGRLAFAYRRPASFRLTERGLELTHRVELLGRVLGQRSTVIPLSNLARVSREVKYRRAGLYAGLLSLVLGTYFGTGLFVDGSRVPGGSAPLIGLAIAFVVAGILLDFVLSGAHDDFTGRCRLVVVPRRGKTLCLGRVDAARADAMLAFMDDVARSASAPPPAPL